MNNREMEQKEKPDYVLVLETAYGPPSQEGFGSAVFFELVGTDDEPEELAKKYYQYFVGELWERWGEETWMTPWKTVYRRGESTKPDIVKELKGINDMYAANSVPMVLSVVPGEEALTGAFDAPEVADLRVYNIGDGEAMSGLLLAAWRENGEVIFLVFLMD